MESLRECGYKFTPPEVIWLAGEEGRIRVMVMNLSCKKCPEFKYPIRVPMGFSEFSTQGLAVKEGMERIRSYCPQLNHKSP